MFSKPLPAVLTGAVVFAAAAICPAQSLQQRIQEYRMRQAQEQRQTEARQLAASGTAHAGVALRRILAQVDFQDTPAREALTWISRMGGVTIVVDYAGLEVQGIDPDQPITFQASNVPVYKALDMVLRQLDDQVEMIWEVTPWYVRVETREQANRRQVVRVYIIDDLLHSAEQFDDAPQFSLDQIMQSTSGGSGGGSGSIFDDVEDEQQTLTRSERARQIIDLIQKTVEPDVWYDNGGQSRIDYWQGKLIVRAPLYVHRQIGVPARTVTRTLNVGSQLDATGTAAAAPRYVNITARPTRVGAQAAPRSYAPVRRIPYSRRSTGISGIDTTSTR